LFGHRAYGISTHIYHGQRLTREHLLEIAAHGFDSIELFATRTHFDYHNPSMVANLQQWLAESGLALHAVHAPVGHSFSAGRWGQRLTLAASDADRRASALAEAEQALYIARRIPFGVFVAHLGLPRTEHPTAEDNSRDAARRSINELGRLAEPLGVGLAIEVIPNELSRAGSLVHFVEDVLDQPVGICLDFGHAHMDGDLIEAIETVSGHLVTTHVHDNRGRTDEHLVPFEGSIDWPAALTAIQKIGYDGTLLLEVAARGSSSSKETLQKARRARARMEQLMADDARLH
jgi:sugar phosphate isomerase/epimerase